MPARDRSDAALIAGLAVRQDRAKRRTADLAPIIADLRAKGVTSLRGIVAELNGREIPTAQGGKWSATQVQRVLDAV
ncbi:recombinase family protein [Methylobacterium sp. CM6257]